MNFTRQSDAIVCDTCSSVLLEHIFLNRGFRTSDKKYGVESIVFLCPVKFCIQCGEKKNIYTDFAKYRSHPSMYPAHHTCKACQAAKRINRTAIKKYLKDHVDEERLYSF